MSLSPTRILAVIGLSLCTACTSASPRRQDAQPPAEAHWTHGMIAPVTAPFLFESPVIDSNVQLIGLHHRFPDTSLLGGGNLNGVALQARLAITERLAVIATKDGWIDFNPSALPDDEGFADIAAGVKYAVVDDPDAGVLLTAGLIYETHSGDGDVLQGNGAGVWRPFLSGLWAGDSLNTLTSVGANLPVSSSREPTLIDWHLQLSPADAGEFVPLLEVNGYYYIKDANGPGVAIEALDYGTVGTSQVEGQNVITGALGGRWRVSDTSHIGLAYERPMTNRKYIFKDRVTADWMVRF